MSIEALIEDAHEYEYQESIMNTKIGIYELAKIPPAELEYNKENMPVCKQNSPTLTLIQQIQSCIVKKGYYGMNPAIIQNLNTHRLTNGIRSLENYVLILFVRPNNEMKCETCGQEPVIFAHHKF